VPDLEEAFQELADRPAQALLVNDASVGSGLQRLNQPSALLDGIPAVICSVPGMQDAAGILGVSSYLVKPVSRDELLSALDRLNLTGNTILIVDDEPDILQLLRRMLAYPKRKYRILRAKNGLEAMNILSEQHPDVILLDLAMPDMDGFGLLERKRWDPALCHIPVVVITARDPVGQPIVSNALAVTQAGGLSVHDLLACIQAITGILSAATQIDDRVPTVASAG
jgi:CheY-like chemotaxis protein